MTVVLRLIWQISLGIALAAGVVSVQATVADSRIQHTKAEVGCQRLDDGLWRGGTPQFVARPRLMHINLTESNMMAIMFGCGSAKHT